VRQKNNKSERQAGTQEKSILGIKVQNDIIHGFNARGFHENFRDDADEQEVYKESDPYIIPVHIY
jgi:hypothetical protein